MFMLDVAAYNAFVLYKLKNSNEDVVDKFRQRRILVEEEVKT